MSWCVDGVPIVSQLKGALLLAKGDNVAAKETQVNFSKRCPGVAQFRSAVQFINGDADGALETQNVFFENANHLFNRAGEGADAIPVVSQLKSVVKYARGDVESAMETQDNFSKRCPIVSQIRSYTEKSLGATSSASETQKEFSEKTLNQIDNVPLVGHINGALLMRKDPERGQAALRKANSAVTNICNVAKDTFMDMLTNSSGTGLTEHTSLERWQVMYAREGAKKYTGVDAAPLMVCTAALAEAHPDGCQICLRNFEEDDLVRLLPCLHMFHGGDSLSGDAVCIDSWLKGGSEGVGRSECPMCRKECSALGE